MDRLAIIVHAFYPEIFGVLVDHFDVIKIDFKLFVSTPPDKVNEIRAALANRTYQYEILETENRGRDIAPFLKILPRAIDEKFTVILKLHTKKSLHHSLGESWREGMYDYLADAEQLSQHLNYLRQHPQIGIVGPPEYLVPMHTYWRANEKRVRSLAARMGVNAIDVNGDAFVAGAMFIARTAALVPLARLSITFEDFEIEQGQYDGTLAHAIERAISYSARAAGFSIARADQPNLLLANYAKFGNVWLAKVRRLFSGG